MNLKYIRNVTTPTATYVQPDFTNHIKDKQNIKVIIECGSRDLLDALQLEVLYPNAIILSFECNPEGIAVCRNNLNFSQGRITFYEYAILDKNSNVDFYSFDSENCAGHDCGVSSLFRHKNIDNVPMKRISVPGRRLDSVLKENNISSVDMLCLDLQGGEYNALLGLGDYINTVKYIIAEFDSACYIGAPENNILYNFLHKNNFVPIYTNSDTLFIKK